MRDIHTAQFTRMTLDQRQNLGKLFNTFQDYIFLVFNSLDELADLKRRINLITQSEESYLEWAEEWLIAGMLKFFFDF